MIIEPDWKSRLGKNGCCFPVQQRVNSNGPKQIGTAIQQAGWLQFEAGAHAHIMAQHSTEEMQIILYRGFDCDWRNMVEPLSGRDSYEPWTGHLQDTIPKDA